MKLFKRIDYFYTIFIYTLSFQDNEEDDQEIEDCEEVNENESEDLICTLRDSATENNEPIEDPTGLLLPDLQTSTQIEPNYDEMDNLTLLSTLCLQESPQNGPLLPNLN